LWSAKHAPETLVECQWKHASAVRFRALTNVDKYVVVSAPDTADPLLNLLGKTLPVEADTLALPELDQACMFVGIPREAMNTYLTA